MSVPNDGGPAFPREGKLVTPSGKSYQELWYEQDGMSLLDYFAAAALQGMLANPGVNCNDDVLARAAFRYAGAMIKAQKAQS